LEKLISMHKGKSKISGRGGGKWKKGHLDYPKSLRGNTKFRKRNRTSREKRR